ncbi:MAG: hypothetical protein HJJLKODD_02273 [Phycisphaerae bacterium]|nr:hypothetical protein [Phycisphaerae bacterium]
MSQLPKPSQIKADGQPASPGATPPVHAGLAAKKEESIFQDPGELLNKMLPWGISLLTHVFLFLLMFLVVWVVQVTGMDKPLPIPTAGVEDLFDENMMGGSENPDLKVTQNNVPVSAQSVSNQQLDLLREVGMSGEGDLSIIGIGAGSTGGDFADFGAGSGQGDGPSFFGLGRGATNIKKVAYVVDRSGSMTDVIDGLKEEIKRSIDRLHRVQQFMVLFFSNGPPIEVPPGQFVLAHKQYKDRAFEFIDKIEPGGSTDPIQAMSRAFYAKPDLIYFLTDGEFSPELIEKLHVWNKDKKVRIYTIFFKTSNMGYLGSDPEALLRQIARENSGDFRSVSEEDLY